jgi:hypothetical protein
MIVFNDVRISYVLFATKNPKKSLKFPYGLRNSGSLFMFVLQFFLVKVIKRFRKDVSKKIRTSLFKLKLLIYSFSKGKSQGKVS